MPLMETIMRAASAFALRNLVMQPRDEAVNRITAMTEAMSEAEFDEFEAQFLDSSLMLVDVNKRVRAMELYAVLKFREVQKFGQFRGFAGPGIALP